MAAPTVSAIELAKIHVGIRAVDAVSFDVEASEVFSLLGPNGTGKNHL